MKRRRQRKKRKDNYNDDDDLDAVNEDVKREHLKLLEEIEQLELVESCCEICHCDCYSSHQEEEDEEEKADDATKDNISSNPKRRSNSEPRNRPNAAHRRDCEILGKPQLTASMANLCLEPTVRAAYAQVPIHDQKILNRMAGKRMEAAAATENAWLARKHWENERLDRELIKCAQTEEFKRAVHDKQFEDYLVTKERLRALAERDLAELQRLRESLNAKDAAAKQRIAAVRHQRDQHLCERRCEELRRSAAAALQLEERQLDGTLRRGDICQRLGQRLRRANELREHYLDAQLGRLRHDNRVEQLKHEEHWRERQQVEILKREQLKADIQRKRRQSQRFVDGRQRRHEAVARTARIAANLRQLVRDSVTPVGATHSHSHSSPIDFRFS